MTKVALIVGWLALASAWAALARAAGAQLWRPRLATPASRHALRELRLESGVVIVWIATLFLGIDVGVGPIEHLRPVDFSTAILVLAALRHRDRIRPPAAFWLLLGMAAWGTVLLVVALDRTVAALGVVQLIELAAALVALYALVDASTPAERSIYVGAYIGGSCLEALFAVEQTITGTGDVNIPTRGVGTLGLFLAYALVPALVYAVWRAAGAAGPRRRWIVLSLILAAGVVASQTRQSWAAAMLGVFVVLFAKHRLAAVAVVVVALFAAVGASEAAKAAGVRVGVLQRVDSVVQLAGGHTYAQGNWTLTSARIGFWKASVKTIERDPLGIGAKNFRFYLPAFARRELPKSLWFAADVEGPHNQFLFTGVELGVPGLLLLLLLVGAAARTAARLPRDHAVLALAVLLAAVLQAVLGDVLFGPIGMLTIGLIAAASWRADRVGASAM